MAHVIFHKHLNGEKMEKFKVITIICAATLAVVLFGLAMLWKSYPKDNYVENQLENVIESQTGIKLDLSPESEEKDDRWSQK